MSMTQQQLRDEVIGNHGGITGKNTQINTFLNLIQLDMSWSHNWRDLQVMDYSSSFAANVYAIPLLATLQRVEFVNLLGADGKWYEIEILPLHDFRKLADGSGTPVPDAVAAVPTHAHLIGSTLTFNKKANQNYTAYIDAFKYPTDMTADGHYPSITVADSIFIAYATAWLYEHRKQPQTAAVWFNMADSFFRKISNKDHGVNFEFTRKRMGI